MVTWDSEQYLRFKRERTQPARDLAMQLPPDDGSVTRVLDIGCGPGNSTAVLRERYPHAKILGVDSSPVMIETARKTYPDIDFQLCDVSARLDELPADFDVVFSNACIQWVPDHPHLIPGLLARLRVGGVLAVQTPMNYEEPIHRIIGGIVHSPAFADQAAAATRVLQPHAARILGAAACACQRLPHVEGHVHAHAALA